MAEMSGNGAKKAYAKVLDYKRTFATKAGEHVLLDLMEQHFILRPTFDASNPYLSAIRDGERAVVLRILSLLKVDVEKLKKQIEENEKNAREQRHTYTTIV